MTACFVKALTVLYHQPLHHWVELLLFRTSDEKVNFRRITLQHVERPSGHSRNHDLFLEFVVGRSERHQAAGSESLGLLPSNLLAHAADAERDTSRETAGATQDSADVDLNMKLAQCHASGSGVQEPSRICQCR